MTVIELDSLLKKFSIEKPFYKKFFLFLDFKQIHVYYEKTRQKSPKARNSISAFHIMATV